MKIRIFYAVAFLYSFFISSNVQAQVTSVNYQLKYNTDSCWYDAFIIINAGSAYTAQRRQQANSQFSIVVPTDDTVIIRKSYMPLRNNQTFTGTVPAPWTMTSFVKAPSITPDFNYYSVTPNLAVAAQYDSLSQGDTVRIFSFSTERINKCGDSIWIFRNGIDPPSSAPGMGGADYSNGFTIGGISQRYNANSLQKYPPKPVIVSALPTCSAGIEIDLTATTNTCQTPLTYKWTGPFSYSSTTQDVNINPSTVNNIGDYKVVVTDKLGCKDSITVPVTNKPNAGSDQTVCAGTTNSISGTQPTTGTWSAHSGNPAGATLVLLTSGNATVTFSNAASGTYRFVYATPSCADTMQFTVNPKPTVSITGPNSICIGATTTLSPSTSGTWASNNTAVATVTNGGVVTAVGQGTATFTYTLPTTCASTTAAVTVNPKPSAAISGTPAVCIGSTTTLIPSTGGTWAASLPAIATVTGGGLVTGVSPGTGKFVFTDAVTSCKSDTLNVTVTPTPTVALTSSSICVTATTTVTPATGGTWQSSDPAVATVTNGGIVTGVTAGTATFTWTQTSTGCSSAPTSALTVNARPIVSLTHSSRCIGNGTTATGTPSGGTWTALNPAVATINTTTGVVSTVAQGLATFQYTDLNGCQNTTSGLTVNPGPTVLAASNTLCIGQTTNLTPNTGGTWASGTASVATVNNAGLVTAVSAGSSIMTFTETSTNCQNTLTITVHPRPVVSITGSNPICAGFTTTLSPTSGGVWTSLQPAIASVNNNGLVTGLTVGSAQFVFTSSTTTCPSLPTAAVTVNNKPVAAITGTNQICATFTTTLSPTSGGTWASSNTAIATVNNAGVVTGVSTGTATFTFTSTAGCVSDPTLPVTVYQNPTTVFTGPSGICISQTTSATPTSGGTWSSSNTSVATVTNAGLITGIAAGTSTLIWTETVTGCASNPIVVTVSAKPVVTLTGASAICIDSTTTVTPTSGGVWSSSNTTVATITNAGVITGRAQGTASFVFTSDAGCASDQITGVVVRPKPTVTVTGSNTICIGITSTLQASETGTWISNNPSVATVNASTGVVTGVAPGVATFKFTSTQGCVSENSNPITVNPKPIVVLNGLGSICVGKTTNLSPTTGGTWISTNPPVATISNAGLITGLAAGTAKFIFTNTLTGCVSDTSSVITVTPGPSVSITGDNELCIGDSTTLSPTSLGTWETSNSAVATVTNAGAVSAVSPGQATFRFTDAAGCKSLPTLPVIVHPRPTVGVIGNSSICVGNTTTLSPSSGGTWVSNHLSIATVNSATGVVTGVSPGTATFTFTETSTSCSSNPTSPVTVNGPPTSPTITGPTAICVGGSTTLAPTSGGVWTSNNASVATVDNAGNVTSIGPGKVTFSFTFSENGCSTTGSTGEVTISHCLNPDFNATFVNVAVSGDVSTNDFVPSAVHKNPVLVSKPSGSLDNFSVNTNGTYTFSGNKAGVYRYLVESCASLAQTGCPTADLIITVTDYKDPNSQPVANVDYATTFKNAAVTLKSLENDGCTKVTGCSLDPSSVTVTVIPANGTGVPNSATGNIVYTPNTGFVGLDVLTYQVCVTGQPTNCITAKQFITVSSPEANNSTVALDDYKVGPQDTPMTGNVSTNDSDPEAGALAVTAIDSTVSSKGRLVLTTSGSWTFTPAEWFFGPVEFSYTSCDTSGACAEATLHILIQPDLTLKSRVYLEGALMDNQNVTEGGTPLMRDNLRNNPFTGKRYIPNADPYRYPVTKFYDNDTPISTTDTLDISKFRKKISWVGDLVPSYQPFATGLSPKFDTIPNPATVFAVTGSEAIVDWVYVELRAKNNNKNIIATRTGLLQRDGDIVDLDGIHGLRFPGIAVDDYFVVIRHFRHLGAMTNNAQTPTKLFEMVDFTSASLPLFDHGNTHPVYTGVNFAGLAMNEGVVSGYRALWAGDFDGNGKIKVDGNDSDLNTLLFGVNFHSSNLLTSANFDFAYGYLPGDFDMNGKAKFDNPSDDKNMLYTQLLFYPLNGSFLSNFDFFIEQLP